jgi:hypothetical protein
MSKDKLDPALARDIAISLAGYGIGALFGAAMIFFATQFLDRWNLYWLARAEGRPTDSHALWGNVWWYVYYGCGAITSTRFVSASIWIALVFFRAPIPHFVVGPG